MPTVKLRFPGGRYHATPWGHHVNEGLVEWPPCPWRLLRALVACGFSTQRWDEVPPVAQRLVEKLAAVPPTYRLPKASAAHSRHFMPYIEGARQKTTLVFDTWANVGDGEILIHWPRELDDEELNLLGDLVGALNYLGRGESWVDAQLTKEVPGAWDAEPCQDGEHRDRGWEQISLMAAIPPREFLTWREKQLETALASTPLPAGKKKPSDKLLKEREKAVAPYPADLVACLTKDTAWWKGHGWSQPPGSRRVLYWRRSDAIQVTVPVNARPGHPSCVHAILLALTTPSGSQSALPSVTRTLPQAELLHRALLSRLDPSSEDTPELSGRDPEGNPLDLGHQHAHILPLDLDDDRHIDHFLVHAPMGLGAEAQRAVRTVRRTWTKGGVGPLQIAVVAQGCLGDLRTIREPLNRGINRVIGPSEGADCWTSLTPFVPPRFLKRRGRNSLEGQVNDELESRGWAPARSVELIPWSSTSLPFRHFVRVRKRGGTPPPVDIAFAIRIHLREPITGPLTLGYGSHFGLGLFAADSLDPETPHALHLPRHL